MNRDQLTMTRGDDRSFAFIIDDEYEADTATLRVDGLFEKTATVGADDGSGYSTVTFTVDEEDTEGCPNFRTAYRYEVSIDNEGSTETIVSGLFVVKPDLADIA